MIRAEANDSRTSAVDRLKQIIECGLVSDSQLTGHGHLNLIADE
jgi:hypothetical protein